MGVQGLTTYVEGNRYFFRDVKLRDSRLVIDGCSLYYRLYFTYGLDQQHGGEYSEFTLLLARFLSALAECNIQPYVVLDGGMDPSDKKFATLRQRLQSKIKDADSLARGRNGCVLPLLTRQVFIQVLIQRGVPLVQCPAEADREIACLAHHWKCPVLSSDSDFYIFDLPGGYLPFQFFNWTNLNGKSSQRYIPARRYTISTLCSAFGSMCSELLPLCAVLSGNDYGAPREAEAVRALLEESGWGAAGGRGKGRAPMSRIESILLWLSSFSHLGDALEEVGMLMVNESGRGKRGHKPQLSPQLLAGMEEYHINPQSPLARWFSGDETPLGVQTSRVAQLPDCLSLAAARGLLSPFVVDALVMRRVMLITQVENSKQASSHSSSRAIRQAIYGILLQRPQDSVGQGRAGGANQASTRQGTGGGRGRGGRGRGGRGQGHIFPPGVEAAYSMEQAASAPAGQAQVVSTPICVEEYDRLDLNLKKNEVEAHPPRNHIQLDRLSQTPVAVRLGVLLEVLGAKQSSLAAVPPHLQLAIAVTGFWLCEAVPSQGISLKLQALVLGMVYGELSWSSQPGATHNQHAVPQLNWAAERNVWAKLNQQRLRPWNRGAVDVGVAHSFSQWQTCLWSALCLNQLLLVPLPEPQLSRLFSGTLVHGLLRYLKAGHAAESLLAGGSSSGRFYSLLMYAVRDCSSRDNPPSATSGGKRRSGRGRGRGRRGRGRGRGGRGAQGGGGAADEINNRFSLLMREEESDDY